MVEKSGPINPVDFKVTVVGFEVVNNVAIYTIRVDGPREISFHLKDRYSSLREFQARVKRQIGSTEGTPNFPKKKYIGNLEPAFLQQRSNQLSLFLQMFLAHPLVKTCPLVPVFFKNKAFGEESKGAIQDLIAFMSGQPIIKPPQ